MYWTRRRVWTAVAAVLALALAGCPSGPTEDPLEAEWAVVQEAKAALDAKRQELADLEALAAAPVEEPAEGEEAVEPVDYTAQIDVLREEVTTMGDAFMGQVVGFLNADPMLADAEPTERQLAAIRLKSSEDLLVARQWIGEGGDYRQAIQIYENSLRLDPDNADLLAALSDAQEKRFMSEERFAAAKKGMSEEAIREALGTPLHHNVKSYEDRGVTAWFYPTSEDGAAAAVWFRPNDAGESVCYLVKYEAVPGREAA
jgi:outer membrane protein assembly factor BamE (lipoprotein component of BamABCDE complex)